MRGFLVAALLCSLGCESRPTLVGQIEGVNKAVETCVVGETKFGEDGTWFQCLPTETWTVIPECLDGKRLTPEGKIVDCVETKP
jgi:hypothetical protein